MRDKLEVSYKMTHQLENELEEVLVEAKRKEEEGKAARRRL